MMSDGVSGGAMRFDLLTESLSEGDESITRIAWYEGLQLLPQHFQALDARLEGLLQRHMTWMSPYFWGVDRLKIDEQAFARGTLRLLAVAGCFPDGLAFAWDGLRDGALECTLDERSSAARYALAVPREDFNESGTNVGRYKQFVAPPLADQTNREEKAAIVRLMPNLSIRRWEPSNPLYSQIPFLEVVNTASGFESIGFHPPAVRLLQGSLCAQEILSLIRLIRNKAAQLSVLPVPPFLTAEYRCGLGWILSSLVAGLPRLEAQMASKVAHPNDLFLSLCSVAGALAPLAGKAPDYFPVYNHADPGVSITAIVRYAASVANTIGVNPSRWTERPFELVDGEWVGPASSRSMQGDVLIRVTFDPGAQEGVIASWLKHALICFLDEKGRCREARVRGLARRSQFAPEAGLQTGPGQCYVHVDVSGALNTLDRRLMVANSDGRAGLVLASVALIELSD